MNRWLHIVWLPLAGWAAPALAADQPVLDLEPTSDWVLDYAEERCSFFRTFGQGQHALTLRIDSFGSAVDLRFLVFGPAVPKVAVPTREMTVRFTPDIQDRRTLGLNGKSGDQPAVAFSANFGPFEDPEAFMRMPRTEQIKRTA
jgi:hypothetical protein